VKGFLETFAGEYLTSLCTKVALTVNNLISRSCSDLLSGLRYCFFESVFIWRVGLLQPRMVSWDHHWWCRRLP